MHTHTHTHALALECGPRKRMHPKSNQINDGTQKRAHKSECIQIKSDEKFYKKKGTAIHTHTHTLKCGPTKSDTQANAVK